MRKLIEFIRSIYVAVLFIVLEIAALSIYARSTAYSQARLLTRSNQVVGGVNGLFTDMRNFVSLGDENRRLSERIIELEEELAHYREAESMQRLKLLADTARRMPYYYTTARVTQSTINRRENFVVLNKGEKDGIHADMALLSAHGAMVGYIVTVSENYSVALTALSSIFTASGRLENSPGEYGSVRWDGKDSRFVTLDELPKYADIHEGDRVITTALSSFFPENVPIGRVESFEMDPTSSYYTVKVRLDADIRSLSEVIIARSTNYEEHQGLEAKLKKRYQ